MTQMPIDSDTLQRAKDLVKALESGEHEVADGLLSQMMDLRESHLFNELGKLTRDFHNALNTFRGDTRLNDLTNAEIPDAKERLSYVIKMTDDAANKTLNAVEAAIPLCASLDHSITDFAGQWAKFVGRELSPAQFRDLSRDLSAFFASAPGKINTTRGHLSDVLMAQDFQDLTGQIIRRVITLVGEVEQNLVNLIKIGGKQLPQSVQAAAPASKEVELAGPQVPGLESATAVGGQDDVDALLSSLGF